MLPGIAGAGEVAALSRDDLVYGNLTIHASFSCTSVECARPVRLMIAGHLVVTALTHRILLERFDVALEVLAARRERPVNAVLVIDHRVPGV